MTAPIRPDNPALGKALDAQPAEYHSPILDAARAWRDHGIMPGTSPWRAEVHMEAGTNGTEWAAWIYEGDTYIGKPMRGTQRKCEDFARRFNATIPAPLPVRTPDRLTTKTAAEGPWGGCEFDSIAEAIACAYNSAIHDVIALNDHPRSLVTTIPAPLPEGVEVVYRATGQRINELGWEWRYGHEHTWTATSVGDRYADLYLDCRPPQPQPVTITVDPDDTDDDVLAKVAAARGEGA